MQQEDLLGFWDNSSGFLFLRPEIHNLRGPHVGDGEAHDGSIEAVRGDNGDFALKSFALPPPTVALIVIPIYY